MYSFNFFFLKVPRAFVVLRPGIEETEENLTNLMESRLEVSTHVRGASLNFSVVATEYIRFLSSVLALKEFLDVRGRAKHPRGTSTRFHEHHRCRSRWHTSQGEWGGRLLKSKSEITKSVKKGTNIVDFRPSLRY